MGHLAHAVVRKPWHPGRVSFMAALLLVWSLALLAGMVGIVAGPLAAPTRDR